MIVKIISIALLVLVTATASFLSLLYLRYREEKNESEKIGMKELVKKLRSKKSVLCIVLLSLLSLALGLISYDHTTSLLNFYRVAFLFVSSVAIAITDFKMKIIPNLFVLITLIGGTVFHIIDLIISAKNGQSAERIKTILISYVLVSVVAIVILCILSAITHSGMGFGDIKYLGVLCYVGGLSLLLFSLSFALISSLIWGLALIIKKQKNKKDSIPFGPFIAFGVTLCIFTGLM